MHEAAIHRLADAAVLAVDHVADGGPVGQRGTAEVAQGIVGVGRGDGGQGSGDGGKLPVRGIGVGDRWGTGDRRLREQAVLVIIRVRGSAGGRDFGEPVAIRIVGI